jgi:hypothetical protein
MKPESSTLAKLRFVRPKPPQGAPSFAQPTDSPTARAIDKFGLPKIPPEFDTPLKRTLYLLRAASEIEHGLLLQYLYAAYSLDTSSADAIDWQGKLLDIAIQEMYHLVCVQNLSRFLKGGGLYFDRANFPIPANSLGAYPFPFKLEPLSKTLLDKYVTVESPFPITMVPADKHDAVQKIWDDAAIEAEGASTVGHVGMLYLALYWLFLPADNSPGEWPNLDQKSIAALVQEGYGHLKPTDFADVATIGPLQATSKDLRGTDGPDEDDDHRVIWNVTTAELAQKCLVQIAAQGEGILAADNSHFLEFLDLHGKFLATPEPRPVLAFFPTNPKAEANLDAAKPWAKLLNNRYQTLLLKLTLALAESASPDASPATRKHLCQHAIIKEMKGATGIAGLKNSLAARKAAPPFELPVDDTLFGLPDGRLPTDPSDVKKGLVKLIDQAAALVDDMLKPDSPAAPSAGEKTALTALKADDATLKAALTA